MKLASVGLRRDRDRVFVYVDEDAAREARSALRSAGFDLSPPPGWKLPSPGTISVRPDAEGLRRTAQIVGAALRARGWRVSEI